MPSLPVMIPAGKQAGLKHNPGEYITEITETQMILRHYYKLKYANKMDNQEEMGKLLERYNQTEPGKNRKYKYTAYNKKNHIG